MDRRLPVRPDSGTKHGFENAPISKMLLIASGAATFNFLFLLPNDYHSLINLHWPYVFARKEIWRLFTSQIVYDSNVELMYSSALIYSMRTLERQWGSKKFASFLLATCSLSLGTHLLCYKSELIKSVVHVDETMASGLYGPLFALLIFYIKDVSSGSLPIHNGISLSNKWLICVIAARMMFTNSRSYQAGLIGLLSGLMYRWNFVYIQKWLQVPDWLSRMICSVYNWFRIEDDTKTQHKKTYAGATEDIHEDMIYDYMLQKQTVRHVPLLQQDGQRYSNILQPTMNGTEGHLNSVGNNHRPIIGHQPNQTQWQPENSQESSADDKIQRLMEMGFTREAAIGALEDTGNNIQEATNILLTR